jgi:site-specific DNA-methyltransferase (cytosine-N4-specific)
MSDNTSTAPKSELSVENHTEFRIAPSYDHAGITIYNGDALEILRQLPDATVNCCITSPPYWGLRDYGTATWDGGDTECDHLQPRKGGDGPASPINGGGSDRDTSVGLQQFHGTCRKCGARRVDSQIGLEPTPEAYVDRLVDVFREVNRVLRDDGTLWLNLGDSFAGGGNNRGGNPSEKSPKQKSNRGGYGQIAMPVPKPKDICGIPWRTAFALQESGWWLRSDIIWAKPNPMPESVTDRPTKAHEYMFLLAKSERYWYDAAAIREPFADDRMGNPNGGGQYARELYPVRGQYGLRTGQWTRGEELGGRNKRDVWTVNSDPFPEAHFATFPPALILPCVLAGCPAGGTVLDPFSGAGTTALVAKEQGRRAIGIELNPDYVSMIARRLRQDNLFSTLL